jgi:GTP-binding protein
MKTISSADVNLLTIDAEVGITSNEKRIAGTILESKSSVIVVVNKVDLLTKGAAGRAEFEEVLRKELQFLPWVPVIFTSATEGSNVEKLVDTGERDDCVCVQFVCCSLYSAIQIYDERVKRIPTRQLWDVMQRAQLRRPPPSRGHLRLKISFVTQAKTTTPTFAFFVNEPELVHFTYKRFLENAIRESFPFTGSPVNLLFKKKEGHEKYRVGVKGRLKGGEKSYDKPKSRKYHQ